jgi:hypothetical protein
VPSDFLIAKLLTIEPKGGATVCICTNALLRVKLLKFVGRVKAVSLRYGRNGSRKNVIPIVKAFFSSSIVKEYVARPSSVYFILA